jgi:type II secretory pathway pseudopilin PulG
MMMKRMNLKKQAGVTLLEVLAYLGIAAVIIVGAISMFGSAQGSAQTNDLLSQTVGLRSNVKTISAGQASYGASTYPATGSGTQLMNQVLIQGKAVPSTLRPLSIAPWDINNSFGGKVLVDGSASDFWIAYTNIPQEVCVKVAPQSSGWVGVRINNNAEIALDTTSLTPAQAAAQCTAGATNTIVWRAR